MRSTNKHHDNLGSANAAKASLSQSFLLFPAGGLLASCTTIIATTDGGPLFVSSFDDRVYHNTKVSAPRVRIAYRQADFGGTGDRIGEITGIGASFDRAIRALLNTV